MIAVLLAMGASFAAGRDAAPEPSSDLGAAALAVFRAKCAGCHAPEAKKIQGKFGFILDMPRLAADKDKLDDLGTLVAADNMPPPTSKQGTLSPGQKKAVLDWLAAGAPPPKPALPPTRPPEKDPPAPLPEKGSMNPTPQGPADPPAPAAEVLTSSAEAPGLAFHFILWIGKFHLLLLHFPVALVFVAALFESWYWWNHTNDWNDPPPEAVRFCLLAAAAFALPVALLGWLHALAGNGVSQPSFLFWHRWLGTLGALLIVLTAWLSERDTHWRERRWPCRLLIYTSALAMGITGHFGGMLVHGEDFLDW